MKAVTVGMVENHEVSLERLEPRPGEMVPDVMVWKMDRAGDGRAVKVDFNRPMDEIRPDHGRTKATADNEIPIISSGSRHHKK